MGFLSRFKQASMPRMVGSGKVWDNVNSGNVGIKPMGTTVTTSNSTPARTNAYTRGPNPEPYLGNASYKDPYRVRTSFDTLQPRIPVREGRNDLWTSVYDDPQQQRSSAQTQNLQPNPNAPGIAFAPTQVRQRDNLYDAGDFRTLQRFVFAYTPSQRHFNERTPLPEFTTPSQYTNRVYTQQAMLKRGWSQAEVPELGPTENVVGVSPAWMLSTPLNVKTRIVGSVEGHRNTLTKVNAPKRKRSGG